MTKEGLFVEIAPLDAGAMRRARVRQARLTKPPGSLGRLEALSIQAAGILGSERPDPRGKVVIVAAGDHGVVAQGVTAYPQAVTAQMVLNFLAGGAAVCAMARQAGVRLLVVDAGVAGDLPRHAELRRLGIGRGTNDITQGPAMTRAQAERCIAEGVALAEGERDAAMIGAGDMGIGNTTASSAITAAMTGEAASRTTGRGTGRNAEELAWKVGVVEQALAVNAPDARDAIGVLAKVGGFEIGVLAGVMLGAAAQGKIVVLDGFISGAAALLACGIVPRAREYMVASHRSAERGHRAVLRHLRLQPVLDLQMRLGEGTGAVLAMGVVEAACACLREMATFDEAGVTDRETE